MKKNITFFIGLILMFVMNMSLAVYLYKTNNNKNDNWAVLFPSNIEKPFTVTFIVEPTNREVQNESE